MTDRNIVLQSVGMGTMTMDISTMTTVHDIAVELYDKLRTRIPPIKDLHSPENIQLVHGSILKHTDNINVINVNKPVIFRVKAIVHKPAMDIDQEKEREKEKEKEKEKLAAKKARLEADKEEFLAALRSCNPYGNIDDGTRRQYEEIKTGDTPVNFFELAEVDSQMTGDTIHISHSKMKELMRTNPKFATQMMTLMMNTIPEFKENPNLMIRTIMDPQFALNAQYRAQATTQSDEASPELDASSDPNTSDPIMDESSDIQYSESPPEPEDTEATYEEMCDALNAMDWAAIEQLKTMGFTEQDAIMGYYLCGKDVEATANFLCNHYGV